MIRYPSTDAQQAAVIKRRTWGGAPVLSGCRSGGCWNSRCIGFCQRFCNRVFQPPLQLRGVGIYSHGCKQGCFQPPIGQPAGASGRAAVSDLSQDFGGQGGVAAGTDSTPGSVPGFSGVLGLCPVSPLPAGSLCILLASCLRSICPSSEESSEIDLPRQSLSLHAHLG